MGVLENRKQVISDIQYFVEKQIDNFIITKQKPKFSFYKYLVSENIDKKTINEFKNFSNLNDTYEEVLSAYNKEDPYLVEAYGNFKKSQLREFMELLESFIQDIAKYSFEKNKSKPRKKRRVSPERQVSKVKFLETCTVKNIEYVGVHPKELIDKKIAYIYDINQNKLSVYYSDGFHIKGTTIVNFDNKKSWSKKIRNSNEVLNIVASGTILTLKTLEEQIKTTRYMPSGRINQNCIILKVF